jgi:uncharacterized protein
VNDYAGLLTAAERERLEDAPDRARARRRPQMAIAVFKSLDGESVEDVANRLFQKWRLGSKALDNGVLLVLFVEDRKVRIEVGYGPRGVLTDAAPPRSSARRSRRASESSAMRLGSRPPSRRCTSGSRHPSRCAKGGGATGALDEGDLSAVLSRVCGDHLRQPRVERVAPARLHRRPPRLELVGPGGWYGGGYGGGGLAGAAGAAAGRRLLGRWWQLGRRRRERELVMARHPAWARRFLSEPDFDAIAGAIRRPSRARRRRSGYIWNAALPRRLLRRRHDALARRSTCSERWACTGRPSDTAS